VSEAGITPDWQRQARTGVGEAVFCAAKSPAQIAAIVALAEEARASLLLTRLSAAQFAALPQAARLDYDALSETAILDHGLPPPLPSPVGIVCAGTSDMRVGREAARTLAFHGHAAPLLADVGVAGLWRLIDRAEEIRQWRIVIAVAGMEGALFSVVAGLVPGLVIAVPTSVGYGVSQGGKAALSSALASCAPGVVAVNIDNGFGAAAAAIKLLKAFA
jgi:NCAIR mutase (PurE)-related protein